MIVYNTKRFIRKKHVQGGGLVNKLINSLPVELHLPGYQFCGPGTKLEKRIQRGDQGINPLDAACRAHDIAYSQNKDIEQRHIADRELTERAWERVKSKNSNIGEKISAYLVTNIMKAKTKLGMGNKNPKQILGQQLFKNALKKATSSLKSKKPTDIDEAIKIARHEIQKTFRGKKSKVAIPRVISVPKRGGFLPLIPILTGLGALGALASGSSAITNAVLNAKKAKQELDEQTRHNKTIEAIAMGKGLYLKPYKKGYGIYVDENKTPKN